MFIKKNILRTNLVIWHNFNVCLSGAQIDTMEDTYLEAGKKIDKGKYVLWVKERILWKIRLNWLILYKIIICLLTVIANECYLNVHIRLSYFFFGFMGFESHSNIWEKFNLISSYFLSKKHIGHCTSDYIRVMM